MMQNLFFKIYSFINTIKKVLNLCNVICFIYNRVKFNYEFVFTNKVNVMSNNMLFKKIKMMF